MREPVAPLPGDARESSAEGSGGVRWVREWHGPGRTRFRVGREGRSLIAEWEGLGVLCAAPAPLKWEVRVQPLPGVEPSLEEKWRRGPVHALVRHLEGRPTLHASAVSVGGRALAFLGESGAGKSTCAADLCRRLGAELLADDTVELEPTRAGYDVGATETSHWLAADVTAEFGLVPADLRKGPTPARRVARASTPLAGVLVLDFIDEASSPKVTPLRGHGAFEALSASFVRFLLDDPTVTLRDLDTLARIVASVPVFLFSRPRRLAALDRSAAAIAELSDRLACSSEEKGVAP
jgi:hypothetical protein